MANGGFEELKKALAESGTERDRGRGVRAVGEGASGEKAYSVDTWETNLSRAVRGLEQGLDWFFGEPGRAQGETLLDELGVKKAARLELAEAARRLIEEAAMPEYRLVVDVAAIAAPRGFSDFVGDPELHAPWRDGTNASASDSVQMVFVAIRKQIVEAIDDGEVLLLVTPEFLDHLPHALATHERCVIAKVQTPAEAVERLRAEVKAGAFAFTPTLDDAPLESWAACWLDGERGVLVHPDDWAEFLDDAGPSQPEAETPPLLKEYAEALALDTNAVCDHRPAS